MLDLSVTFLGRRATNKIKTVTSIYKTLTNSCFISQEHNHSTITLHLVAANDTLLTSMVSNTVQQDHVQVSTKRLFEVKLFISVAVASIRSCVQAFMMAVVLVLPQEYFLATGSCGNIYLNNFPAWSAALSPTLCSTRKCEQCFGPNNTQVERCRLIKKSRNFGHRPFIQVPLASDVPNHRHRREQF